MKNDKRFVCIYTQGNGKVQEVWVDTQTGANYLFIRQGLAAGLSPLLDANGKPIISKEYIKN